MATSIGRAVAISVPGSIDTALVFSMKGWMRESKPSPAALTEMSALS